MSVILLVFFMNGFTHYEQVATLDDCFHRGSELVQLGFIDSYQCASVIKVN